MNNIVGTAYEELGYAETGDNDTKFGKWYGMNNQPWCAMFVSWVFHKIGEGKKVNASSKKGFASCDAGLKWFAKKGKLVPVGQAQEGDIVFFQFDTDAQPDHVGIVVKNNIKRQRLVCIEGNTSPDNKGSQSNGGEVAEKKRAYATVMAVARP
jgi:cell wall-associated NlpC family hydrolase